MVEATVSAGFSQNILYGEGFQFLFSLKYRIIMSLQMCFIIIRFWPASVADTFGAHVKIALYGVL